MKEAENRLYLLFLNQTSVFTNSKEEVMKKIIANMY